MVELAPWVRGGERREEALDALKRGRGMRDGTDRRGMCGVMRYDSPLKKSSELKGMAQLKHPITGAVYSALDEGTVEVDSNGLKGVFRYDGEHVSGELRFADPHMLLWLGGPQLPGGDNVRRNRG